LGVDGVVLIAHGRSDAKAIRGAIRSTIRAVDGCLVEAIQTSLSNASQQAGSSPTTKA
jgi:glycerol-3-phosphate acyltransferase PlsX